MVNDIISIVDELTSSTKQRYDNTDVAACLLFLRGEGQDAAYYASKARGILTPSVLANRAIAYFESEKISLLLDALRPIVNVSVSVVNTPAGVDWKSMDVDSLTSEELEKMGTFFLRNAALRGNDVDTKEINDLIKMLDSVGALPKKQQNQKVKQVVVNIPFNDVCTCGKEVFNPLKGGYFLRGVRNGDYEFELPLDVEKQIDKFLKTKK